MRIGSMDGSRFESIIRSSNNFHRIRFTAKTKYDANKMRRKHLTLHTICNAKKYVANRMHRIYNGREEGKRHERKQEP